MIIILRPNKKGSLEPGAVCSGSLLSDKHVISTAHCVFVGQDRKNLATNKLKVRAGDITPDMEDRSVSAVFTLREFNNSDACSTADISILLVNSYTIILKNFL